MIAARVLWSKVPNWRPETSDVPQSLFQLGKFDDSLNIYFFSILTVNLKELERCFPCNSLPAIEKDRQLTEINFFFLYTQMLV